MVPVVPNATSVVRWDTSLVNALLAAVSAVATMPLRVEAVVDRLVTLAVDTVLSQTLVLFFVSRFMLSRAWRWTLLTFP